jgi:hypothetical protein
VVSLLLAAGADVNDTDKDGWTPLLRAALGNHASTAKILIDHRAKVDHQTSSGYTALMSAARWGCADVVPVLLGAGASVNTRGRDGRTALAWAKEAKVQGIVDALRGEVGSVVPTLYGLTLQYRLAYCAGLFRSFAPVLLGSYVNNSAFTGSPIRATG